MLQNVTDAASDCIHEKNHAVWKETKTVGVFSLVKQILGYNHHLFS